MLNSNLLRLAAALLFVGVILTFVAGLFHPAQADPNDHIAAFSEYASNASWTVVHLGQFVGMAIIVAGLVILFFTLNLSSGMPLWFARLGAVLAIVSLALYGVLQAVDGVALKQAVDAWMRAPEVEKAARFASAEAIRWMEWAIRSYQSFVFGLALVLFAVAIVWSARISRLVGYLIGLSGLGYIAQGWVLGSEGFSASNSLPTLVTYICIVAWSIWLLIIAWRTSEPAVSGQNFT
jgi:hypothetical protein